MKLPYRDGTWFAVPLRGSGFAVGIVARFDKKGRVLGYFFGPRRQVVPRFQEVETLKADSAILVLRFADLGLIEGEWPIIGQAQSWNRLDWPLPVFIRREPPPRLRNWLVYYSDDLELIDETLEPSERPDLPPDSFSYSGAVEIKLTVLLDKTWVYDPLKERAARLTGQNPRIGRASRRKGHKNRQQKERPSTRSRETNSGKEQQAVLLHLRGTGLPAHVYEQCDLVTLEDKLEEVIQRSALGDLDGNEVGAGGATIYMYGPDAEKLFKEIEPVLRDYPLCRGATVTIRHGGPGAPERETAIP
jgi:hypothetical protein